MKKSLFVAVSITLLLSACAKRGYEAQMAPRDSVPLYNSPATIGGGISSMQPFGGGSTMPPVTASPIAMQPIASNIPTTNIGGVQAAYQATGNINAMPPINSQETAKQFVTNNNTTNTNYLVQSGDTIYAIGRKFNINPNEIIKNNPQLASGNLMVGQSVNIPNSSMNYPNNSINNNSNPQFASLQTANNNGDVMGARQANNDLLSQIRASRQGGADVATNNKNIFFKMPTGSKITQKYDGKNATGIRVAMPSGTNITAPVAGKVLYVGTVEGYGQMVLIRHDNGYVSNYAGLGEILVKQGQAVSSGDVIAKVSSNGNMSETMFELRDGVKTINPMNFVG